MKISYFYRFSFRTQLAITFGIVTFVVLVTASLIFGFWFVRLHQASIQNELQARVHAASELVMQSLKDRTAEIIDLSRTPDLLKSEDAIAQLQDRMNNKRALKSEYAWMGVANPDGKVITAAGKMLLGKDVTSRDWFKVGRTATWLGDVHEAVLLSRLLPRENENEPLRFIDIAAPVQNTKGELIGVLGAHLHWSWVTTLAESVLPEDASVREIQVYILSRDGVTLYPFADTGKISFRQNEDLKNSATEIVWSDSKAYVTAQIGLPQTPEQHLGWRVVLRQPVEVAYAPLKTLALQMIVLTLAMAICAAWLAYRVAAFVNAPIALLVQAVQRLGVDTNQVDVPKRLPQELRTLADAIQIASTDLTASRQELVEANEMLERRVEERTRELELANDALARQAMTDGLTNVANRRAFDMKQSELHALSARTGQAYGLLIIDVDHFKQVNDNYGHHVGDQVLAAIASKITASIRTTDFVARYGGEEFAVMFYPVTTPDELAEVAEKLRKNVSQFTFSTVGHVTISLGGCMISGGSIDRESGLKFADGALYQSKLAGRNRYTLA
ncbi:sensor domain-containing diguanylate cyclase [Undibacterium luofuense]|uniref:diguanylate cyclase n=1 Tax=Undibacterium luofuense TaxID=2828733 RepID=A0A941DK85_9BURK|nr:sensor domain-containing diguanylate cyclase [Undibacterium luofuense]MBR7782582.1 GGDEF domain-containing protein [Undibacterium luofuense]